MLIKACLNGSREASEHPALPLTPEQLADAAEEALAAGAGALHIHPRRGDGAQSLDAHSQGAAIQAIRRRCPGAAIGVSTAMWIEANPVTRLAYVHSWTALPDFASVNFDEPDAVTISEALLARGIGVEAGLSTATDVTALAANGLAGRLLRALIEPGEEDAEQASRAVEDVIHALDAAKITTPRLLHGTGAAAWPMVHMALTLGYDTRIGFEDTLHLPTGAVAASNAEVVAAVVALAVRSA